MCEYTQQERAVAAFLHALNHDTPSFLAYFMRKPSLRAKFLRFHAEMTRLRSEKAAELVRSLEDADLEAIREANDARVANSAEDAKKISEQHASAVARCAARLNSKTKASALKAHDTLLVEEPEEASPKRQRQ